TSPMRISSLPAAYAALFIRLAATVAPIATADVLMNSRRDGLLSFDLVIKPPYHFYPYSYFNQGFASLLSISSLSNSPAHPMDGRRESQRSARPCATRCSAGVVGRACSIRVLRSHAPRFSIAPRHHPTNRRVPYSDNAFPSVTTPER